MPVSQGNFHISVGKVVALEQQRQVKGHGQAITEAIAQVEAGPVAALAEMAPALEGLVEMVLIKRHNLDAQGEEQLHYLVIFKTVARTL